ncbi:hypothetical protein BSKO_00045 [Bryopsis sp. KO-2023]|nr:hypothetical protein BSKO_00045 [Bryopsis sp. KO-2023]
MLHEFMWQSEDDWPLRKGMVNEIRNFFAERNSRLVSEKAFPNFVKKLELVLYENAKSEEEYVDRSTLLDRLKVCAKRLSPTSSPESNAPTDTSNLSGRTEIAVSDESSPEAGRTVATTRTEQQQSSLNMNGQSNIQRNMSTTAVPSRKSHSRPGKRRSDSAAVNPSGSSRCKLSPTLVGENQMVWNVPDARCSGVGCDLLLDQRKDSLNRSLDFGFSGGQHVPKIKAEGDTYGVGVGEQRLENFSLMKREEPTNQNAENVTQEPEVPNCQPWECLDSSFEAGPLAGILNDEVFPEPDFSSGDLSWLHDDFLADKSFPCVNAWDEVPELEEHIAASTVPQEIFPDPEILAPSSFGDFATCAEGLLPTNGPMMDMPYPEPQVYQGVVPPSLMTQTIEPVSRSMHPATHMGLTHLEVRESVGSLPSLTSAFVPGLDMMQPVSHAGIQRGSDWLMPNLVSPRTSQPSPYPTRKEYYSSSSGLSLQMGLDSTLFPDVLPEEVDPLTHAYECRQYPCTTMCEQLKKLFDHVRRCRNRGGNCSSCRWLGLLMSVHAPNCKGKPCRLPCCTYKRCQALPNAIKFFSRIWMALAATSSFDSMILAFPRCL